MSTLRSCEHWVFDMDGTLTVAVHDFDAIRDALGLPPGEPILEFIEAQPPDRARDMYARLDALELELVSLARPEPGAGELLDALRARGANLGIVTRNSVAIAHETLRRCGLDGFFDEAAVLGRESAPAKPEPDGILTLLSAWGASAEAAVMVGDYLYDLEAGRRAGCTTVYFDPAGAGTWTASAHFRVCGHRELLALAGSGSD